VSRGTAFRRSLEVLSAALPLFGGAGALLFARLLAAGTGAPSVVRTDPRLDTLVPPGAAIEKIADGFAWLEGPLWDARAKGLFFSDIPANAIYLWRPHAVPVRVLQPSGYTGKEPFAGREPGSNGLAFDAEGRLVFCAHGDRAIVRIEHDGRRTVLASRFEARRLNSPNDLVFAPAGDLYFTDPPFGLPLGFDDPGKELPYSGLYRLSPDGRLTLLTKSLGAPNGLAFSPDGRTLYVSNADAARAVWMAFPVRADGTLEAGRVFFDATAWARPGTGNPDGLKVDARGNLFAAGPGGVHVFAPTGAHLGRLAFDVPVSNVAFGEDGRSLFVTASTAVWRVRLSTRGAGF
jgi:gluconolactonase